MEFLYIFQIVPTKHVSYFNVLKKTLHTAERSVVSEHLRSLFKIFLDAFGLCLEADYKTEVQADIIATFLELVVKINEAIFKPLFRRLFDWAFASDAGESPSLHTSSFYVLTQSL